MELCLDMERFGSVDRVLARRSKIVGKVVSEYVHSALTTSVAVSVDSVGVGRVALVPRHVEGILISLHDVELGAPVTANLVCITVAKVIVLVIDCWHHNSVDGRNTATAHLRKVNVVVHDTSEQVHGEELVSIESGTL